MLTITNEISDLFLEAIYVNVEVENINTTCIQIGCSKGPIRNKKVIAIAETICIIKSGKFSFPTLSSILCYAQGLVP